METDQSFWLGLVEAVREPLYAFAAGMIPILGALIYHKVAQWTNKDVARLAQQMFQDAAKRAAGIALNQLGDKALTEVILPSDPAVVKGMEYMHATMPDTMAELKVTDKQLAQVIIANIGELTAPALGPVGAGGGSVSK